MAGLYIKAMRGASVEGISFDVWGYDTKEEAIFGANFHQSVKLSPAALEKVLAAKTEKEFTGELDAAVRAMLPPRWAKEEMEKVIEEDKAAKAALVSMHAKVEELRLEYPMVLDTAVAIEP